MEKYKIIMEKVHNNGPQIKKEGKEEMLSSLYGYIHYVIAQNYPTFYKKDGQALFNEAVCGILEDIERFDPEKGNPLQYFRYSILHKCSIYIDSYYNEMTTHYRKKVEKVEKSIEFFESMGLAYTDADIARHSGLSEKAVIETRNMHLRQSTKSGILDAEISDNYSPLDYCVETETADEIHRALNSFEAKDRQIIIMRYFKDFPYKVIAKEAGIPLERVQAELLKVLRKLKKCPELQYAHPYSEKFV